ncbi:hypothetical protein Emed_007579 [Eimeria media]
MEQPLLPGGQPAARTGHAARVQLDRTAREREHRAVPGRFRFTDLRQVQVVRHVLAHPASQRELIHKELVYLHRRLRAYRSLRLEFKKVGPDNITQYALQRNFEAAAQIFIDTLAIPLQSLPDPVTLRGLWPDPLIRLEEQGDPTYINEFPEVLVLRDMSNPLWNDFLTPYSRQFLACPSPEIAALRNWRPIPYVCTFSLSSPPLDDIAALQLAVHDRLRGAQVDDRAVRRWARLVEAKMLRCREELEHLERVRLENQQDLAAALAQTQQQVGQSDGVASAVNSSAQAPAPAAPQQVRPRRQPRRIPRRAPQPAPPPPPPPPQVVESAQRSTVTWTVAPAHVVTTTEGARETSTRGGSARTTAGGASDRVEESPGSGGSPRSPPATLAGCWRGRVPRCFLCRCSSASHEARWRTPSELGASETSSAEAACPSPARCRFCSLPVCARALCLCCRVVRALRRRLAGSRPSVWEPARPQAPTRAVKSQTRAVRGRGPPVRGHRGLFVCRLRFSLGLAGGLPASWEPARP